MSDVIHPSFLHIFSWKKFGFPGRDGHESTLWVGTEGAYTPCHQDTYGENLVAQLEGSKTWILFPPDQSRLLAPTRVPYEESSVYSAANLLHLSHNSQETLSKLSQTSPYIVTLEPGDVLFVPRHWWHQVYSNNFSISVNTWLEHPEDDRARLGEAIIRCQIAQMLRGIDPSMHEIILNPNEDDLLDTSAEELVNMCGLISDKLTSKLCVEVTRNKVCISEDAKYIEPSTLTLPENLLEFQDSEHISRTNEPLIKRYTHLINSLTDSSVVNEAVNCFMKSHS